MSGIVTAGSPATAAAGAEMLEIGGNAVDAAVAAVFAAAAGEPTLTSLAGGGVMTFRDADSGSVTAVDFFSNVPGVGADADAERDFFAVDLNFGPTTQEFQIGRASAAVPGAFVGICEVHERWGRLPLSEVVRPTVSGLRAGVSTTDFGAEAARLLEPILAQTEVGRSLFWAHGHLIRAGDVFTNPALAGTLEEVAAIGWRPYYENVLCPGMLAQFGPSAGGLLTAQDLAGYSVKYAPAMQFGYRGSTLSTPPPPAAGGELIRLMLGVLETLPSQALVDGWARALANAMKVVDLSRREDTPGPGALAFWREEFATMLGEPLGQTDLVPGGPSSTTHISVIDGEGNAVGVTVSHGEGNGVFIGDTGIHMNNFMGEADLHPNGWFAVTPGERLMTMMTPTVMEGPDGALTVLGSGGANRIRSAITQLVCRLLDRGDDPEFAVRAARLHFEHGVLNAETFDNPSASAALTPLGAEELVLFPQLNMFFGGVHLARRRADGTLEGAGDPRRSGTTARA
jgi:gamma-glutamyltranspeptidase/glutathione hydrolase